MLSSIRGRSVYDIRDRRRSESLRALRATHNPIARETRRATTTTRELPAYPPDRAEMKCETAQEHDRDSDTFCDTSSRAQECTRARTAGGRRGPPRPATGRYAALAMSVRLRVSVCRPAAASGTLRRPAGDASASDHGRRAPPMTAVRRASAPWPARGHAGRESPNLILRAGRGPQMRNVLCRNLRIYRVPDKARRCTGCPERM